MSEITKFQEYSKKLQGICDENDLVYRFRKDGYPVTLTIAPSGGVSEQLSLLADEKGHMSPDARLIFYYLNGELCYKISKDFSISDTLFSKLKNLYKNMSLYWHMYFFREMISRGVSKSSMPVIDESTEASGGDNIPPEAEPLEEDIEDDTEDGGEDEAEEAVEDPDEALITEAVSIVRMENTATVSLLQRRLKLGYSKAARLMDILEERGVVGPYQGGAPREVLPADMPEDE